MISYKLIPKRARSSVSRDRAGADLIIGSLTLKCIIIAPIINMLNTI